jgi:pyridoxamine 5'-phosphate oxidase
MRFQKLDFEKFLPDPFEQFDSWFSKRLKQDIPYPESMSLASSSADGRVSLRTVLLKGFGPDGFTFFTNYKSLKGKQLIENPNAAILFYWPENGRQVRIEGTVVKVSVEESDEYFSSRPSESRLSAWASEQSSEIPSREYLESRFSDFRKKFAKTIISRPPWWGGFRLQPVSFEFWQEGKFRMHDRICYSRTRSGWKKFRLSP